MANTLYPSFRTALLSPGVNLLTADLKAALVQTGSGNYTYSGTHEFFSSVPSGAIVAPGVALSGKAVAAAALTAGALVFPAVAAGKTGHAIVLYIDSGDPATSRLVGFLDTQSGLPVVPTGQDVTVTWTTNVLALA